MPFIGHLKTLEPLRRPRRRRVLDLEPSLGPSRTVRVLAMLGYDAFEAELAGVVENDLAVALDVLVILDARGRLREQPFKPRLPSNIAAMASQ
jgi:hypothetical protein